MALLELLLLLTAMAWLTRPARWQPVAAGFLLACAFATKETTSSSGARRRPATSWCSPRLQRRRRRSPASSAPGLGRRRVRGPGSARRGRPGSPCSPWCSPPSSACGSATPAASSTVRSTASTTALAAAGEPRRHALALRTWCCSPATSGPPWCSPSFGAVAAVRRRYLAPGLSSGWPSPTWRSTPGRPSGSPGCWCTRGRRSACSPASASTAWRPAGLATDPEPTPETDTETETAAPRRDLVPLAVGAVLVVIILGVNLGRGCVPSAERTPPSCSRRSRAPTSFSMSAAGSRPSSRPPRRMPRRASSSTPASPRRGPGPGTSGICRGRLRRPLGAARVGGRGRRGARHGRQRARVRVTRRGVGGPCDAYRSWWFLRLRGLPRGLGRLARHPPHLQPYGSTNCVLLTRAGLAGT